MPKPPPRLSSGTGPSARRRSCRSRRRRADSTKASVSKIWLPMWACRPVKERDACDRMRATRPGASASVIPNFWSSRAVARYSCVWACTPLFTRRRTGWTRPCPAAAAATRSTSIALSTTIWPIPAPTARSISATDLLLPWKPRRAGSAPPASATASSPPEQTSMCRPSSTIQSATSMLRNALPA